MVMRAATTISVLLAVYNTDFFLVKRAIDSVLNQDFTDFELIIIDDGSHNDPQHQLLSYVKQYEAKITYLRHSNRGQSQSINRGILNSNSEFITILDADDEFKPHHLRHCLAEMRDADLIASITETITDREEDYYVPDKYDTSRMVHVDDCILFATLFGRKEVFTSLNFEDIYAADASFYERASLQYRVKKVDLRTYIYYRNIPTSICSELKRDSINLLASSAS
jgi:glycosyltransferase involved in cell wall biosynthesis